MVITTATDSIVPSCHSFKFITPKTDIIIIATQIIDMMDCKIFWVAKSKMIKANKIEITIPCFADETKAYSVGIRAQTSPVV